MGDLHLKRVFLADQLLVFFPCADFFPSLTFCQNRAIKVSSNFNVSIAAKSFKIPV